VGPTLQVRHATLLRSAARLT